MPKNDKSIINTVENSSAASLADRAYEIIEEMIISTELPPRSFLSEIQLSKRLNIGRTPVREALKRLEADALVAIVPSRGIMVTEIDIDRHLLLLEVRRELERLIARRAAIYATDNERKKFRKMSNEMSRAAKKGDEIKFRHIDQEFNHLLDASARNPVATQTIRPLRSRSRQFWFQTYRLQPDSLDDGARTHCAVMMAIAAGDVVAAATASDLLMDYVESFAKSVPFARR